VGDGERARLIAWDAELRTAHERLRAALQVARADLDTDPQSVTRDLLLYCHGFCVALGAHHLGEDAGLFPELKARHPELRPVIAKLEQDHSMISHLLAQLDEAMQSGESGVVLRRHLDGLGAIMESHFRYEERELLGVLAELDFVADPAQVFGSL
jgi:hemerythrin-like domain-containing protein